MRHVSGISGAGPIWHDFMEAAHHGVPVHNFSVPDGFVWHDICPISGHLVGPDCPYSRREVFIAGTEPQAECDQHVAVLVDRRTGERATPNTPASDIIEKVYWLAPPELREWARARDIPRLTDQPPIQVAEAETRKLVALTSPDPYTVFTIAPFIPSEHQRVSSQAEVYTQDWPKRVILYVDGEVLANVSEPPYRALWTLEVGEHTFHAVAVAQDGSLLESGPIRVLVEEE
jgi:penicillin-binding protein 1C